jgi:hypothetical protein
VGHAAGTWSEANDLPAAIQRASFAKRANFASFQAAWTCPQDGSPLAVDGLAADKDDVELLLVLLRRLVDSHQSLVGGALAPPTLSGIREFEGIPLTPSIIGSFRDWGKLEALPGNPRSSLRRRRLALET